jgi:nitroimidazol reductase NimA-like FMN-containing flavoprotein (pyridoxamine 5'-phosphate oxidase superfamily)
MTATMSAEAITEVMNRPYALALLASRTPARLAYTSLQGDPRVVPVGYDWDGTQLRVASATTSAKTAALQANSRVALSIDTEDFPPKVLLLRGTAHVEVVDGVPDVFLQASKKRVSDDQWTEWEAGVRNLYDQMAVITIRLTWAKLLDFETTIPQAEADIMRARNGTHDRDADNATQPAGLSQTG